MIGKRIREARKARGLTISQLGALCGIHQNSINKLERGHRLPSLPHVIELAYHLEVSLYYLVTSRETELWGLVKKLERIT